jgi:8-oxo-dGTP pyrophosphatase MutT (NUDIX family)
MLLVQQVRPPVDAMTVELPAGLIDAGESAEAAALRELKEETGFVGTVASRSSSLAMSPGLTDEAVQLVVVHVDIDRPENRAPKQELEETEDIRVRRVPIMRLKEALDEMVGQEGCVPIMGLYTLAVGLQQAQVLGQAAGRP